MCRHPGDVHAKWSHSILFALMVSNPCMQEHSTEHPKCTYIHTHTNTHKHTHTHSHTHTHTKSMYLLLNVHRYSATASHAGLPPASCYNCRVRCHASPVCMCVYVYVCMCVRMCEYVNCLCHSSPMKAKCDFQIRSLSQQTKTQHIN